MGDSPSRIPEPEVVRRAMEPVRRMLAGYTVGGYPAGELRWVRESIRMRMIEDGDLDEDDEGSE